MRGDSDDPRAGSWSLGGMGRGVGQEWMDRGRSVRPGGLTAGFGITGFPAAPDALSLYVSLCLSLSLSPSLSSNLSLCLPLSLSFSFSIPLPPSFPFPSLDYSFKFERAAIKWHPEAK